MSSGTVAKPNNCTYAWPLILSTVIAGALNVGFVSTRSIIPLSVLVAETSGVLPLSNASL